MHASHVVITETSERILMKYKSKVNPNPTADWCTKLIILQCNFSTLVKEGEYDLNQLV